MRSLNVLCCISFDSYIKPQPVVVVGATLFCCISFGSYIKPQQCVGAVCCLDVVYLLIPTSNHNLVIYIFAVLTLYIFWFLHQTTTQQQSQDIKNALYIFWFLHQTTTYVLLYCSANRCISFDSYIKPQPRRSCCSSAELYIFWFLHQTTTHLRSPTFAYGCISFDSYIKPQLNFLVRNNVEVVYLLIPTSNHNSLSSVYVIRFVVYLLIPTSNHNWACIFRDIERLYIFWFLHQTTTPFLSRS